ncbi:MAG: DNA polymerase domain-containing protein, partial [Paraclostridium sp.]
IEIDTTLLDTAEYIMKREPIITPYGVLFRKHADAPNPIAKLLDKFIASRKANKKKMFQYPKGSEMFEKYNLLQLLDKIDANGVYGILGQCTCLLYNINIAASITAQGQSCISAAGLQFEMFLADNYKFGSLNEVITFLHNIIGEKNERLYHDNQILDNDITIEECFFKVMNNCGFKYVPTNKDLEIVWDIISVLDQQDLNRIFYKNNLYSFMENKSMTRALEYLLSHLNKAYLDPNEPPEEIEVELNEFRDILMEYVYYHHQLIDKVDKYDNMYRSIAVITDTDSEIVL